MEERAIGRQGLMARLSLHDPNKCGTRGPDSTSGAGGARHTVGARIMGRGVLVCGAVLCILRGVTGGVPIVGLDG